MLRPRACRWLDRLKECRRIDPVSASCRNASNLRLAELAPIPAGPRRSIHSSEFPLIKFRSPAFLRRQIDRRRGRSIVRETTELIGRHGRVSAPPRLRLRAAGRLQFFALLTRPPCRRP